MPEKHLHLNSALYDYLLAHGVREHPVQAALRLETAVLPAAMMQIPPEQGALLAMLVRLTGARRILEVGTFTGYSALSMALALPDGGKIVACDISEEWTAIGRRAWEAAGVAGKIDLRLAPATDTLSLLLEVGDADTFDLAFIDADKANYAFYYEYALMLVRPGGLIVVDNVLWGGAVAEPDNDRADTVAIRKLNETIAQDARVAISMLPIADGLTLVYRNP